MAPAQALRTSTARTSTARTSTARTSTARTPTARPSGPRHRAERAGRSPRRSPGTKSGPSPVPTAATPATPDLGPGLRLVDRIGSGGMGTVWRAVDLRAGAWVAVKVVGLGDAACLARAEREQSVRLRHPHVACARGWAEGPAAAGLVMDLVRGPSLAAWVESTGPLRVPQVAHLLGQVLSALATVHAAGVVHRDITPANVLLEAGPGPLHARLVDFGIAARVHDDRMTTEPGSAGTPGWAAPEQACGAAPSPAADLWSVGHLGLYLLTGSRSAHERTAALASAGTLRPLLEHLLAQDPERRPASAVRAGATLSRLADPTDPTALPGPVPDHPVPDVLGPPPPVPGLPRATRRRLDPDHAAVRRAWWTVAACASTIAGCGCSLLGLAP